LAGSPHAATAAQGEGGLGRKRLAAVRMAKPNPATEEDIDTKIALLCLKRNYCFKIRAKAAHKPCFPFATAAALVVCTLVFYLHPDGGISYDPSNGEWYSAFVAMFSHSSDEHLWINMTMLAVLGWMLEITEGPAHVLCVMYGGGLVGSALHGATRPEVRVRGFSGVAYAIMCSQISLLALNWSEMPLRYVRLFVCFVHLTAEIAIYNLAYVSGTSYASHLFGAIGGVCVSLCFGHNVRLRRWEFSLVWLGVCGYVALLVVGFVGEQYAASALGAVLVPALVVRAGMITHRSCKLGQRREQATKPTSSALRASIAAAATAGALLTEAAGDVLSGVVFSRGDRNEREPAAGVAMGQLDA